VWPRLSSRLAVSGEDFRSTGQESPRSGRDIFRDEGVESGLRVEQRGIKRPLLAIARMQTELALGGEWSERCEVRRQAESETAEGRRQRGNGCSLAAADEKVAPARINELSITEMRIDLTRLTQLP